MRRMTRIVCLAVLLSAPPVLLAAAPPQGAAVSYLTADGFYIGAGSAAGLAVGDTVRVLRNGEEIAAGRVTYVSESSASCELISGTLDAIQVGDTASFRVPERMLRPIDESPVFTPAPSPAAASERVAARTRAPSAHEIEGRVGLQLRGQHDGESGREMVEPGVTARLRIRNLFNSALKFELRARTRRTMRDHTSGVELPDEWNNRVYEASLEYDRPESPLGYRAGRIYANHISGIGAFDGACLDYEVAETWTAGAFAGLEPEATTSRISPEDVKTGVFLHHEPGDWPSRRLDATVAIAGSYNQGEIDREFAYQQLRYSWSRTLALYESAELGINRGWRKEVAGSTVELNNILLNARWSPGDGISFDGGFDNRRTLRTIETKDTPDSMFDDAYRQGWRLGSSIQMSREVRLSLQGGLRTRSGVGDETVAGHARLSDRDLFDTAISGDLGIALYDSPYSSGLQPSLGFAMYPWRSTRCSLEGGARGYKYIHDEKSYTDFWLRPEVSFTLSRAWYGQAYYEYTRGDLQKTDRVFLELGVRF